MFFVVVTDTMSDSEPLLVDARISEVLTRMKIVFEEILDGDPPNRGEEGETIPIIPGSKIPFKRMYRLSPLEQEVVDKQIAELLRKEWIKPSNSPYPSPILDVKK